MGNLPDEAMAYFLYPLERGTRIVLVPRLSMPVAQGHPKGCVATGGHLADSADSVAWKKRLANQPVDQMTAN